MDFVINLDDVWKWVGFSSKANSKHLLEKQFIIDKDYKLLLTKLPEQTLQPRRNTRKGDMRPPSNPPINVVQKTDDFLHLFLSTAQKEGCGERSSPGWSAQKWINCK